MTRRAFVLLLGLLLVVAGATGTAATPASTGCLRAEDFGAVPNDGQDDRDQLQAAIVAAQTGPGCLTLGPGTFQATRRQVPGENNIASLRITAPLEFRGAGAGVTTLAMLGPGTCTGCQSFPNPAPWRLLDVSATSDVTVGDLSFDGSARTSTNEQTHLVQVNGPTNHVVIERARFTLPAHGGQTGGDCVRLLGTPVNWVRDTTIRDTVGLDCDRSFVGVQRGVDGAVIERSESVVVGDQAIDFEPTGAPNFAGQPIVKNVLIRQVTLRRGPAAQGATTVTVHGDEAQGVIAVVDNVTITDSVIEDGGVSILDAHDVTLSRLNLRSVPGRAAAPVTARGSIRNLRILDTELERLASSGPGQTIQVSGQPGANPVDVLISGVHVVQATTEPLVHTAQLARLVIVGTRLDYTGPPQDEFAVVAAGNAAVPVEQPVLVDVTVTGPLAGAADVRGIFTGEPVLVRQTGP